jgi:hypothetical protein
MLILDRDAEVTPEVVRLRLAIEREAAATGATLTQQPAAPADDCFRGWLADRHELNRQLCALRELAAGAESRNQDLRALRSELATLLSFARTLRTDAQAWRTAREQALVEHERQKTAERQRRRKWLAEHQDLVRRRDALQLSIDQTAKGLARANGGECRRTLPVVRLAEALIVCSVTVSSPWSRFRPPKLWLVTLNDSCDEVLVRRG